MSGGKKRSGFQITSVTSEVNQSPADQLSPSAVLPIIQSEVSLQPPLCSPQGSSSQPTTPSLKRKYISLDGGHGAGSSSRFRVVRLVSGAGGGGRGESYRRGRWMCTEFTERQEGPGFRRVMDSMRHAHSLESLEMIGRESERGGVHSQDNTHMLAQHVLHSGPPSPTHQTQANVRLLDHKESRLVVEQGLGSTPPPPSPRPRFTPTPLRLDVDASGRTPSGFSLDRTMFDLPGDARTLQLVAKQLEPPVVLRDHTKVKGRGSAVRESWPSTRTSIQELKPRVSQRSLTPPSRAQPVTEARHRSTNQPQPSQRPQNPLRHTAPHPHWSVPARASPTGQGSEATMMALLLFCNRSVLAQFVLNLRLKQFVSDAIPSMHVELCSDLSLLLTTINVTPACGYKRLSDLVKSHLMLAVREEVELLREQIRELQERNRQLERENHTLRALTHSMHTH
ncbi:TSC22 domain family protein 4 [Neolamprologus brichardi]|uniref:TSC22 domain family protein 4 n=1 Tax=Neolamprologus brichardi TaxID=32507 RepID=UPI001643D743|nr:TSC22 domain family protein 4 [Neolamprologus brichardi]